MIVRNRILKIVLFALFILWTQPASAQYANADSVLTVGQPITLTVSQADTLTFIYRPGSNISDTVHVPIVGNNYRWTPSEAGLVALTTPNGDTQDVSVRFDDVPLAGYIILFGAAFILLGGAIFASSKLFGKETPKEIAQRPDT